MCDLRVAYSKNFIFQSVLRGPLPGGENGGRCFEQPCLPEKAAPALHWTFMNYGRIANP